MHRFFVSHIGRAIKEPTLVHQLSRVLRVQPGDRIVLCTNDGVETLVEIGRISHDRISIHEISSKPGEGELPYSLTLCFGLIKHPDRTKFLIEKSVELGVSHLIPLICDRSQIKDLKKRDRLKEIIREASEQSGRSKLATLHDPLRFTDLTFEDALVFFPDPSADITLSQLSRQLQDHSSIVIVIGPEGGFSPQELTLAKERAFHPISLGTRILRAETACISTLSQVQLLK